MQRFEGGLAVEHRLAGEEVVADAAQRIEVRAPVHILAESHLGRHVGRRPGDEARLREVCPPARGHVLHEAEVHDLYEVRLAPVSAEKDVPWLDVAVHEARAVRFGERAARLPENEHDALRHEHPMELDELVERIAVEELHDVVEGAVVRAAEVVELDRVRRAQAGRRLRLALEARHELARDPAGAPAHELDPAVAEGGHEPVAPELLGLAGLSRQAVGDPRADDRDDGGDGRREKQRDRESHRRGRTITERDPDEEPDRVHERGRDRREDRLPARGRDEKRERHDEDGNGGEPLRQDSGVVRDGVVDRGEQQPDEHLVDERAVEELGGIEARAACHRVHAERDDDDGDLTEGHDAGERAHSRTRHDQPLDDREGEDAARHEKRDGAEPPDARGE